MNILNCSTVKKLIVGGLLFAVSSVFAYSYWYVNGTGRAFDYKSEVIEHSVIQGAGHFLDSYSATIRIMKEIELSVYSPVNIDELRSMVDRALNSMVSAENTYKKLKDVADNTPYNPSVIDSLKTYVYDGFAKSMSVGDSIFSDAKKYLSKGDIRSIYGRIQTDTRNIIDILKKIKVKVDSGEFPSLDEVWNLNQTYSKSLLFGQYVAQVFNEISQ